MSENKKSIIKEALIDHNAIMEAANINAQKKLAKEFPEKFNELIKEELETKKINKKESYKKIDENKESKGMDKNELNKESVMKSQTKETKKVVNENQSVAPFNKKPTTQTGIAEEFNITELDIDGATSALDNASPDDEFITMDEIEQEIANFESPEEGGGIESLESPSEEGEMGVEEPEHEEAEENSYDELVELRDKLDVIINSMGAEENSEELPSDDNTDLENSEMGGETETGEENFENNEIDETQDDVITDEDIASVLGNSGEQEVDEAHGLSYPSRRNMAGRNQPNYDNLSSGEQDQAPVAIQESKKKFDKLIEENKKLTKKFNDLKKNTQATASLVEGYKSALEKYRNQLREMAIFNTNLAHVNNLLVNEELALTQDDKIKIINEFKNVENIGESQKKYKAMLSEMKTSKNTITENIEDKVSVSIQPSSKLLHEQVVEKTAYENNDHIQKIKNMISYVENGGKRKK